MGKLGVGGEGVMINNAKTAAAKPKLTGIAAAMGGLK
jgi:hypothetical protein